MVAIGFKESFFPFDTEAVVFVDEWKGPTPRSPRSPIAFFARMFRRTDTATFKVLRDLLSLENAHEWHQRSLLHSRSFHQIIRTLDFTRELSTSFFAVWSYDEHRSKVANEFFINFQQKWPDQLAAWRFDDPYQRALFFWGVSICGNLSKMGIESARIISDHFDEFQPAVKNRAEEDDGFARFQYKDPRGKVNGDYIMMTPFAKKRPTVLPFLPWINLIDGELWMIQRSQSTPLSDGRSIWERNQEWNDLGRPADYQ